MFRTLARKLLPNPLDWMLKKASKRGAKKVLLCWNRGLGDIALGLYAIVQRIKEFLPEAEITFLARENLREGFSMLEGVEFVSASWKRGEKIGVQEELRKIARSFDLVIKEPSPTDWVRWQHGKVTPRLKWCPSHDPLWEKFDLGEEKYVGIQVSSETNYGFWRNWPVERWQELFDELEKRNIQILLFGFDNALYFQNKNILDLRGKTTLFELLSIIKNCCSGLILPDSGILSMVYYLDVAFPIRVISLWADPCHGILKQNVASPNPQLLHIPIIGELKNLSSITAMDVLQALFPARPLQDCTDMNDVVVKPVSSVGAIILAGGQGTRLGFVGPKGLFAVGGKSLFEHLCANRLQGPIAIMTSPQNHEETVAFFAKNKNFGCEVYFFQQEMMPLLNEERTPTANLGPNGNGNVFRSFVKAGLGEIFSQRGIEFVTVSGIENPLTDIFDAALASHALSQGADVIVQCIKKEKTDVCMGVLVERKGIEIIEYTELDPKEEYKYVYSGQMGFNFNFFLKMSEIELPVHWVRKKVNNSLVWKGEQFIFDVLPYASRVCAMQVPRAVRYAPIKGPEHVEKVEAVLKEKL